MHALTGNAESGEGGVVVEGVSLTEEAIKERFSTIDANGNGSIEISELGPALEGLLKRQPSEEELSKLIGSVDINNDGELQLNEIVYLIRKFES